MENLDEEGNKKRRHADENDGKNKKQIKKQKESDDSEKLDQVVKLLLFAASKQLEKNHDEDKYTSFGKYIAIQLRKLPEIYSAMAMDQIQQVLAECTVKSRHVSTSELSTNNLSPSSQTFQPVSPAESVEEFFNSIFVIEE